MGLLLFELLLGAVLAGVAHGVAAEARAVGLEVDGAGVFAGVVDGVCEGVVGLEEVHAVELVVADFVGVGHLVERLERGDA